MAKARQKTTKMQLRKLEKLMKKPENLNESLPTTYGYIKNLAEGKYLKFGYVHTDNQRIAFVHKDNEGGGADRYKWRLSANQAIYLGEIHNDSGGTPGYFFVSSALDGEDYCIYSTDSAGHNSNMFYFERPSDTTEGGLIKSWSGLVLKAGYDDKGDGDRQVYGAPSYLKGDKRFLWILEPA